MHFTQQLVAFSKEAGFHDRQYNYFYEWVLQSLLWLDNDIITTTVGSCLTTDQHRSSVLFLFTLRVCRCRNSLLRRCESSGSVFWVTFYPRWIFVIQFFLKLVCLLVSARRQGCGYIRPELSLRGWMRIYAPVCAAVDAASGPLSDVWCLSVGMNFPFLQRLLSTWSPFLPFSLVLKNKPLILGALFSLSFSLSLSFF